MKKLYRVWTKGPYGPWEDSTGDKALPLADAERVADLHRAAASNCQVKVCQANQQPWEGNGNG